MKIHELLEAKNQKSWRDKIRKIYGDEVTFWNDIVHKRAIARSGGEIVGTMDLKSGAETIFPKSG